MSTSTFQNTNSSIEIRIQRVLRHHGKSELALLKKHQATIPLDPRIGIQNYCKPTVSTQINSEFPKTHFAQIGEPADHIEVLDPTAIQSIIPSFRF